MAIQFDRCSQSYARMSHGPFYYAIRIASSYNKPPLHYSQTAATSGMGTRYHPNVSILSAQLIHVSPHNHADFSSKPTLQNTQFTEIGILIHISPPQPPRLAHILHLERAPRMQSPCIIKQNTFSGVHLPLV